MNLMERMMRAHNAAEGWFYEYKDREWWLFLSDSGEPSDPDDGTAVARYSNGRFG